MLTNQNKHKDMQANLKLVSLFEFSFLMPNCLFPCYTVYTVTFQKYFRHSQFSESHGETIQR